MSVKTSVVEMLETNRNNSVSGQELAEKLGVSRMAVCKAIKQLRQEGYEIVSETGKGYLLQTQSDVLSEQGIVLKLKPPYKDTKIIVKKTLISTNTYAKKLAMEGECDRTVIVSNEQTGGRGRRGKEFYSPADTGLYMSCILRPEKALADVLSITISTAVAVCRAIENLTGLKPLIKWVNDIFIGEKKACGILTEAISDFESGMVEAIIIGIGVNIKTQEFPDELAEIATSLNKFGISRNEFAAEIVNQLYYIIDNTSHEEIIEQYKLRSLILGKMIRYEINSVMHEGVAVDINSEGNLIVQEEKGEICLKSGEISIRKK